MPKKRSELLPKKARVQPVFGIGAREMVIIGLPFLVIFGPSKIPQMARHLGRFASEARLQLDEFKAEIASTEEEDRKNSHRR